MSVPGWYALLILALGTFRLCRLVGWDDLTIPARRWLTGIGDDEHSQWAYIIDTAKEHDRSAWSLSVGDFFDWGLSEVPPLVSRTLIGPTDQPYQVHFRPPVTERRYYLSKLIRCPWCLSVYIGAAAWLAWQAWPHATLALLSIPALWAVAGLIGKLDLSA